MVFAKHSHFKFFIRKCAVTIYYGNNCQYWLYFIVLYFIADQDGGRRKQQHQHTTFKSSYILGIIIERVQKQHIMTS